MKVLLCNKFYRPVGGPENVIAHTMHELSLRGHTPIPFAMEHPDNAETEYSQYFVPMVDYNDQGRGVLRRAKEAMDIVYSRAARRRMEKLIADLRPDVAHLHNIYHQLSPSILLALRKSGIPTVLSLHDYKLLCANMHLLTHGEICERCGGRRFYHAVLRKCVKDSYSASLVCCVEGTLHRWFRVYERNTDIFVAPSHFLKALMTKHGRLQPNRIEVLHTYANTRTISPDYRPGKYGLFIGRMERHKGVRTVLSACRENPDFEIRFAGEGLMLEEGRRFADQAGLANVNFLGFQTGDDLKSLLARSRFVLVPSEWYENCPMVILEAFSAGKPVIASNIGGIPELVDHGADGFLFEPGDVDGLASAIRILVDDPNLASEMGRRGRAKVEERFSIASHMDALLGIYRRLVGS